MSGVCTFSRFGTKESATHAIVAVHNTEINGQTVKCSWGKEAGDPANVSNQVSNVICLKISSCSSLVRNVFSQGIYLSSLGTDPLLRLERRNIHTRTASRWGTGIRRDIRLLHKCKISFCRECKATPRMETLATSKGLTWGEFKLKDNF